MKFRLGAENGSLKIKQQKNLIKELNDPFKFYLRIR